MKHGSERIKKDSERLRNTAVREDQYKNPFKYTFDSYRITESRDCPLPLSCPLLICAFRQYLTSKNG